MNDFEKPLMDLAFDLQLTQTVHEDLSQCLAVITQKNDFFNSHVSFNKPSTFSLCHMNKLSCKYKCNHGRNKHNMQQR